MRKKSLEKITSAAMKVFAEYGYYGATLKKITQATGLSYGLVYHYFSSKEEIFLYLLDIAFDNSKRILDTGLNSSGTPWEKIQHFSKIMAMELQNKELAYHFTITQLAMTQATDIKGIDEYIMNKIPYYEQFDRLIKQAQESGDVIEGDAEILAAAYLALAQGLALMKQHQYNFDKKIDPEIFNNLLRRKK